jgi:molybdate transport system substrate-binding protein
MLRILAVLCLLAVPAAARELHVLTGAGMAAPVRALVADFGKEAGVTVDVVSDTAGGVQKRMEAGEKYDLVIGTSAVLDALSGEHLLADQHHALAQMVAGLSVKKGQPKPDLSDVTALRELLRKAASIAYVDPAQGGITGVFFLGQADRMGVGEHVRDRAVLQPDGAAVAESVARGDAQYGVTLVSEMLPNKDVTVLALPDGAQMTTIYAGALAVDAQNALDAASLLDTLAGRKGHDAAQAAGLKPIPPLN